MGGFYYPDQFMYEADQLPALIGSGILGVFAIIYFVILSIYLASFAVTYVLRSWSLYTIAKRRGIRNGWLAWIPLGNLWILGNISDQYQYVVKGRIKNRRKKLMGFSIGLYAGYFLWLLVTLTNLAAGREATALFFLVFGGLIILTTAIYQTVCRYLAYYDLYRSCDPGNAVLYLVLSVFFTITLPFFVFACRDRDLGMPPRKKPAAQQVVVPTVEPVTEEGYARPEDFEEE